MGKKSIQLVSRPMLTASSKHQVFNPYHELMTSERIYAAAAAAVVLASTSRECPPPPNDVKGPTPPPPAQVVAAQGTRKHQASNT